MPVAKYICSQNSYLCRLAPVLVLETVPSLKVHPLVQHVVIFCLVLHLTLDEQATFHLFYREQSVAVTLSVSKIPGPRKQNHKQYWAAASVSTNIIDKCCSLAIKHGLMVRIRNPQSQIRYQAMLGIQSLTFRMAYSAWISILQVNYILHRLICAYQYWGRYKH